MSPTLTFNPPAGSTPLQATEFVTGALEALNCEASLKRRQVSTILTRNLSVNTFHLLATFQVAKNSSLVADGLIAAANKYYNPLNTMFSTDPIPAIMLRSEAGRKALYTAFRAAGHIDSRELTAFMKR